MKLFNTSRSIAKVKQRLACTYFEIFYNLNFEQWSVLIFSTSRHYYFFEKLKIVKKNLCKLNCSYGKIKVL